MASSLLFSTPSVAIFPSTNPLRTFLSPPRPTKTLTRRRTFLPPLSVSAPPTTTTSSSQQQQQEGQFQSDKSEIEIDRKFEDNEEEEEGESSSSSSKFSWRDHWYPVSLIEDLDIDRPTPFQLLNRDLVLWFDRSKSEWAAFDDKCPHRLAPLSVKIISTPSSFSKFRWSHLFCCIRINESNNSEIFVCFLLSRYNI